MGAVEVVGIVGLNDPVVFVLILEVRCVYCEDFKQPRWATWDTVRLTSRALIASSGL